MTFPPVIADLRSIFDEHITPHFLSHEKDHPEFPKPSPKAGTQPTQTFWSHGTGYGFGSHGTQDWSAIEAHSRNEQERMQQRFHGLNLLCGFFQSLETTAYHEVATFLLQTPFLQILCDLFFDDSFRAMVQTSMLLLSSLELVSMMTSDTALFGIFFHKLKGTEISVYSRLKRIHASAVHYLRLSQIAASSASSFPDSSSSSPNVASSTAATMNQDEAKELADPSDLLATTIEDVWAKIEEKRKAMGFDTDGNVESNSPFSLSSPSGRSDSASPSASDLSDSSSALDSSDTFSTSSSSSSSSSSPPLPLFDCSTPSSLSSTASSPASTPYPISPPPLPSPVSPPLTAPSPSVTDLASLEHRYIERLRPLQFKITTSPPELFHARHKYASNLAGRGRGQGQNGLNVKSMRRIMQEVSTLSTSLPLSYFSSVFVTVDTASSQLLKALVIGPKDTPYEGGAYEFDIYFPAEFPNCPPQVTLLTTGGGRFRFNPNLYACGKVCLSLLGTWSGSAGESWNPTHSTLLQVLVSIQSLIFVDEPYFNEPGYESSMNTPSGKEHSRKYNQNVRKENIKIAILDQLEKAKVGDSEFSDVILAHFAERGQSLVKLAEAWNADTGIDAADIQKMAAEFALLK